MNQYNFERTIARLKADILYLKKVCIMQKSYNLDVINTQALLEDKKRTLQTLKETYPEYLI
jgi:hypothetical protein